MTFDPDEVQRLDPGIDGLDVVTRGGLPKGRLTLVAGTAGSGKTVAAAQFLAAGIAKGEAGVFVTFEERPSDIRRNVRSFGWDVEAWEQDGKWSFVDGAPRFGEDTTLMGNFDLSPLVARVRHAVEKTGATRVSIDSIGALVAQFESPAPTRRAMFQLAAALEEMDITTMMTGERSDDYGAVTQFGFEEFVSDNVIILRNSLSGERRRRTVEVLKIRGGSHLKGEHLFTLKKSRGIVVIPQQVGMFGHVASTDRLPSGIEELDRMCNGGMFDKSLVMVSGPTGTGKSLVSAHFVGGAVKNGETAVLHSFEESHDQLCRNARQWGIDFEAMEREGKLHLVAETPESASLEDHLLRIKSVIDEVAPDRVAIDSLTALQRVATVKGFREYVLGLSFHIKEKCHIGLVTATTGDFGGGPTVGDLHISTISDMIVLLQYVGVGSQIRRGINVLKMRGSDHDKSVREFVVRGDGMHILEPFVDMKGAIAEASAGNGTESAWNPRD